uniref:Putative ATPase n=1 Tax=Trypanosoma congolense (strain IL3000) TaxID=1068625 RepID=G0UX04_TRYCI|nr:putative ATPase [Trypanosoma congolense IL3000]
MRISLVSCNAWRAHVSDKRNVCDMYNCLVHKGVLKDEPGQRLMVQACTRLADSVKKHKAQCVEGGWHSSWVQKERSGRWSTTLYNCFNRYGGTAWMGSLKRMGTGVIRYAFHDATTRDVGICWPENIGVEKKTGLYLWGDVGIGKTLVMDLFELSEDLPLNKRRDHLHSFMCDLVLRLQRAEAVGAKGPLSPIDFVVTDILDESPILCLDEVQTIDVTHASLLNAFLSRALPRGLVLFATSNRPPQDLTSISDSFARCVPLLWHYCDVVHCDNIRDYRENASPSHHGSLFLHPNTVENAAELVRRVERGFVGSPMWVKGATIWLYGRELTVPYHCGGVALFDFCDICRGLGPPDFQCIAKTFHTIIITNIPNISGLDRNAAQQFVILVDELYQFNVKLLFTSEGPWDRLLRSEVGNPMNTFDDCYTEGVDERSVHEAHHTFRNKEELLSFGRIESRLKEMGCRHYLLRDHKHFVISDYSFTALVL